MATSCKKCSYPPAPWKVLLAEELQEKSYIFQAQLISATQFEEKQNEPKSTRAEQLAS